MRKLQRFFTIVFTIFGLLVILQAVLHQAAIVEEFNSMIVIQYFIVSNMLAVTERLLQVWLHKLPVLVRLSATIAAAFFEVILVGGVLMHWYTIRTKWVLLSLMLSVVITVVLYFITGVFETKHTAEQINRVIQVKRKDKMK